MKRGLYFLLLFAIVAGCDRDETNTATAPKKAASEVNVLAMGDWGQDTQAQRDVARTMARYVERQPAHFNALLTLGDNFYVPLADVNDPAWQHVFEHMYDPNRLNFPFYASLGNHDYDSDKYKIELEYASKHPDSRWKFPSKWYRVDLPAGADPPLVTVFMLDSNRDSLTPEEWIDQLEWLGTQLGQPRIATWLVACAHHPFFSNGAHGDNGVLQTTWGPIFKSHHLDFYVSGHDHDLQHLQPEGWPMSFVVSGGGGAQKRAMLKDNRGPFSRSRNGFTHIRFLADRAIVHFISSDGTELHSFQRTREGQVINLDPGGNDKATTQPLKVIQGLDGNPMVD